MTDLKSRPNVSPLTVIEFARYAGILKSVPSAHSRIAPYRRPYKVMKSRRRYYVHGKVSTVAMEAAWGGVDYASLMDGRIKFGN